MKNLKNQLRLAKRSLQSARMLIDQQMWCWGCDVRRSDGNLLLLYGGQKRPSPNPRYKSAYSFQVAGETVLNLWSWGLWIACPQHGSLFLGRSRFRICYAICEIELTKRVKELKILSDKTKDREFITHDKYRYRNNFDHSVCVSR